MRDLVDAAISILYPRRCPVCDRPVEPAGALICRKCEGKVGYVREPVCMKCGKPLENAGQEYCRDCGIRSHYYDRGAAVFIYRSVDRSIYRFKYEGRQEYAAWYGEEMAKRLRDRLEKWAPDALVPVPIHPARLRKRGYNQSGLIAEEMGRKAVIPVKQWVRRVVDTAPQKGLGIAERQKNLEKAFKIVSSEVKSKSVVVVDDIYTTGATVDAVACALRRAGAARVFFVALAIGDMN